MAHTPSSPNKTTNTPPKTESRKTKSSKTKSSKIKSSKTKSPTSKSPTPRKRLLPKYWRTTPRMFKPASIPQAARQRKSAAAFLRASTEARKLKAKVKHDKMSPSRVNATVDVARRSSSPPIILSELVYHPIAAGSAASDQPEWNTRPTSSANASSPLVHQIPPAVQIQGAIAQAMYDRLDEYPVSAVSLSLQCASVGQRDDDYLADPPRSQGYPQPRHQDHDKPLPSLPPAYYYPAAASGPPPHPNRLPSGNSPPSPTCSKRHLSTSSATRTDVRAIAFADNDPLHRTRPAWTEPNGPIPPFITTVPDDFEEHRWNMAYVVHAVGGLQWHPDCGCYSCKPDDARAEVNETPMYYPGREPPKHMFMVG